MANRHGASLQMAQEKGTVKGNLKKQLSEK